MSPLRVGVIGCGAATLDHHLPALMSLRGVEVIALADLDGARAAAAGRRCGIRQCHEDHRELLARPDVDAVCIAVPPSHHAAIAGDALNAGKHVLVEKPLALTLAEADTMVGLAEMARRRDGRVAAVGFNLRCHRLVARARRVIASGRLGQVVALRSVLTSASGATGAAEWRRRRSTGGGVLRELAIHHFDLWRHLLQDEVAEICGARTTPAPAAASDALDVAAPAVEDLAIVHACMRGGTLVSGLFGQATADCHEIELFGSKARMRLSLYRSDGFELDAVGEPPGPIDMRVARLAGLLARVPDHLRAWRAGGVFRESYRCEWRLFVGAIATGGAAASTFVDGREALAVAVAALAAADHGGPTPVARVGGAPPRAAAASRAPLATPPPSP